MQWKEHEQEQEWKEKEQVLGFRTLKPADLGLNLILPLLSCSQPSSASSSRSTDRLLGEFN